MSELVNLNAQITFDHASLSTAKADEREVERAARAVQYLNRTEFSSGNSNHGGAGLSFTYDKDTQRPIVTVVDRVTGAVLSQMPAKEVLRLAAEVRKKEQQKSAGESDCSDGCFA